MHTIHQNGSMRDKTCLITGATGGLGKAAAFGLARLGARVVLVSRNTKRILNTINTISKETGNNKVHGIQADLSVQSEVRRAASEFLKSETRLDVLINNVGGNFLKYQCTPDGIEYTWALNYLNHFLLTRLLLDRLVETAGVNSEARIIGITSSIYRLTNNRFDRLQGERGYNGVLAYAQSKRAVNMFYIELARRLQSSEVTANVITPGYVATGVASNNHQGWARILMKIIGRFSVRPEEGVKPIVYLASSTELKGISGQYYTKYKRRKPDPGCHNLRPNLNLWELSEKMLNF